MAEVGNIAPNLPIPPVDRDERIRDRRKGEHEQKDRHGDQQRPAKQDEELPPGHIDEYA